MDKIFSGQNFSALLSAEILSDKVYDYSIQVRKATVKENGDVYIDSRSVKNFENRTALLNQYAFATHDVDEVRMFT